MLKDALKNISPDEVVYLGAASSFLFIGERSKLTGVKMQGINKKFVSALKRQYAAALKDVPKLKSVISEETQTVMAIKKQIKPLEKKLTALADAIERLSSDDAYATRVELRGIKKAYEGNLNSAKKSLENTESSLEYHKGQYEKAKMLVKTLPDKIEKYVPIQFREVREIYPHKWVEPIGTTILIEGEERGEFWTLKEQEEANGCKIQ